jgi:predicted nuclease of predicted toxin-antitoxin system
VKLLVDMNISPLVVGPLNAAGHAAVHWMDLGPASASDETLMAWAQAHDTVLLTHDLDFGEMLAASGAKGRLLPINRATGFGPSISLDD